MKPLLALILLFFAYQCLSAKIQYADSIISFSSEFGSKQYSAKQALGKANLAAHFGRSPVAWSPKNETNQIGEWLHLAFKEAMNVNRIAIFESFNPGAISEVILYEGDLTAHTVFRNNNFLAYDSISRISYIDIPQTPYLVKSIKIILQTSRIPGFNQIDAVAISDTKVIIENIINLGEVESNEEKAENLGFKINSAYSELAPIISYDGKKLYFARDKHPENYGNDKKIDIWYAELNSEGKFEPAKNINAPMNDNNHNFLIAVSPSETEYWISNAPNQKAQANQGIFKVNKNGNKWSEAKEYKIKNWGKIGRQSSYSLGGDGKTLLMSVERSDSYGGNDLYVSFLEDDSTWTEPLNLGISINSAADEASPFLAADNNTLYFASAGFPGFGELDMFVSKRLDNSWQNWTEPINLGKQINTKGWDAYYTLSAKGDFAYFVSTKNSIGAEDIFRISLPKALQPEPVILINGKVIDRKSGKYLAAKIKIEDLENGNELGIAFSDSISGEYKIVLPKGKNYGFLAEAKGYIAINENINLKVISEYNELNRDLNLVPIEAGEIIRINNIFFDFAKSLLLPESKPELNRIVKFLQENSDFNIEIAGHTDAVGNDKDNLALSLQRAKAVENYLINAGIDKNRLSSKGYGKSKAIADNKSEEGRQKNRRVEFILQKLK